ncbi:putative eg45-like domain containing protein 1 [Phtheirospermum japonicum]|uniref:Putative eg45-like domain containing protein 1 n=1 Tax=Phtheirospermum japonicum TaxID=374723 RepID=A0A830CEW9_9LAMI|nr:putative eg45-like domain containing protein 1 [Phtheirospermum japonicum]
MLKPEFLFLWLSVLVFGPQVQFCRADIGTASRYTSPYTPTACYGGDPTQFPLSNYFAAAGEGIWDNGAACGRQYLVQCISAAVPQTCVPDKTIQVRIVDRAQSSVSRPAREGSSLVLSSIAFDAIANNAVHLIWIDDWECADEADIVNPSAAIRPRRVRAGGCRGCSVFQATASSRVVTIHGLPIWTQVAKIGSDLTRFAVIDCDSGSKLISDKNPDFRLRKILVQFLD